MSKPWNIATAAPFENRGISDMQNHLRVSAIVAVALFASTASVVAQTGEFANQPPGSTVHQGYALQDWWQSLRNGTPEPPPPAIETAQPPVVIMPPAEPNPVKPKKSAKKVTANSQPKPPQ
jgi:hypothetical protein